VRLGRTGAFGNHPDPFKNYGDGVKSDQCLHLLIDFKFPNSA
jgi:hypothetical protein